MATLTSIDAGQVWTTERKLFRAVTEPTSLIAWATDVDGLCFYLSPEWYRFTGYPCQDGLGFNWLRAIHPDDQDMVRRAFLAANASQTAYGVAYRLARANGAYTLIWAVGLPKFGETGKFEGFFGTVFPIEGDHRLQVGEHSVVEHTRRLTEREREVLQLIAEGNTAETAASILGITRRTVETHIANAGLKLGGVNRVHTVVQALKLNEI
jgi:PAS domain S-box-containing protein